MERERESLIYPSVRNPLPPYDKVTPEVMALPSLCSDSCPKGVTPSPHKGPTSQHSCIGLSIPKHGFCRRDPHQSQRRSSHGTQCTASTDSKCHRSLRDNQIKIYLIQTSSSLSHQEVVPAGETQTAVLSQGGATVL